MVFTHVLDSKETEACTNKGFRARDNKVFSYEQERAGFGYYYIKRIVQNDGVSTEPLDIILKPLPSVYI